MMHAVALQGPPRSGKDTAGLLFGTAFVNLGYQVFEVKASSWLKHVCADICGGKYLSNEDIERIKDAQLYDNGPTFRQVLINFSENFAKPTFGNDFFGRKLVDEMLELTDTYTRYTTSLKEVVFVITDAGFADEQLRVQECVKQSYYSIVQMHREGYDFTNDSRSYFCLDHSDCIKLHNDSTIEELGNEVLKIAQKLDAKWNSLKN